MSEGSAPKTSRGRMEFLDLLPVISVFLVMYGHFVIVGNGAKRIAYIIDETKSPLPILSNTPWYLVRLEIFLVENFVTQSAVLGVAIFFLITGYLMPMMLERYSRTEFLINRFFRIFPVLIAGTLAIGAYLYFAQGLTFSLSSYLASWTLTYNFLLEFPVAGVLWTLVVEVLFYLLVSVTGKFDYWKLFGLQLALALVVATEYVFRLPVPWHQAGNNAKYLLMICVGSAVYLAETKIDRPFLLRGAVVIASTLLALVAFQALKLGTQDTSTYANLGTHFLALALFSIAIAFPHFIRRNWIPHVITFLSDLVYPIYILHAAFGLAFMASLRAYTSDPLILVAAAVMLSVFVSWLMHVMVEKPFIALGRRAVKAVRRT